MRLYSTPAQGPKNTMFFFGFGLCLDVIISCQQLYKAEGKEQFFSHKYFFILDTCETTGLLSRTTCLGHFMTLVNFSPDPRPGCYDLCGHVCLSADRVDRSQQACSPCQATLQRNSHLCIPFLGIAQPQYQFPHSCVCQRCIYSQNLVHIGPHIFLQQNRQPDPGSLTDI